MSPQIQCQVTVARVGVGAASESTLHKYSKRACLRAGLPNTKSSQFASASPSIRDMCTNSERLIVEESGGFSVTWQTSSFLTVMQFNIENSATDITGPVHQFAACQLC